jgi:hypothetical protein
VKTFNENVDVNGLLAVSGGVICNGGLILGEGVGAGGAIATEGDLNVSGNADIGGSLTVSGELAVTGNHRVDGTLTVGVDIVLSAQDCAEDFDTASEADDSPGTVMIVDDSGLLRHSTVAYDNRVAGVVSGASPYRPAMILGRTDTGSDRSPIALVGRVSCKVDASFAAICAGDLLTTSPTPGCAMKATNRDRAFGAVIGKALQPLAEGRGMVTVLVGLQ